MNEYKPIFEATFVRNLRHYGALRKQIQRRVDRILATPYHNTELLADDPSGLNLVGCRSARVDRNFRIIFVICTECRQVPECEYCFCDARADQTVVFLTVGPHDQAYAME